jgi:hypothetical protein
MTRNQKILLGMIAAYVAAAFIGWPQVYVGMLFSYAQQLVVIPMALLITLPAAALILHRSAPFSYIFGLARGRLLRFVAVAAVFCAGLAAFTTLKIAIPDVIPFYADPLFADIDALLHGGDPGEIVHALVPAQAQYFLGVLYGPIWLVQWFGLIGFVALSEDKILREQYFWSMAAAIALLGTVVAAAFSSVGPIFYERVYEVDRFAPLAAMISDSAVGDYMTSVTGYLYQTYLGGPAQAGAGISAMPSMHLAIATLNALMLSRLNRAVGVVAALYVALILLGSVYLGWHYAIDGYFSIAATGLIWVTAGRMLSRATAGQRGAATPAPPAPGNAVPGVASEA